MEYKNKASQAMNALQYDTTDYTSLNKSTDTFSDGSHYGVSVLAFNTATEINSFIALRSDVPSLIVNVWLPILMFLRFVNVFI